MNLSYHLDVQSGPTIVLVGAVLFGLTFVVTGTRGLRRAAGLDVHDAPPVALAGPSRRGGPGPA
jgi:hypothetical protein